MFLAKCNRKSNGNPGAILERVRLLRRRELLGVCAGSMKTFGEGIVYFGKESLAIKTPA